MHNEYKGTMLWDSELESSKLVLPDAEKKTNIKDKSLAFKVHHNERMPGSKTFPTGHASLYSRVVFVM